MSTTQTLRLEKGSEDWKKLRLQATRAIPGKRSALYFLNSTIRNLREEIPMTERAHLAMCMFAEGATGIPAIDEARVKMILVPRGVGKTGLITQGLPLLRLLKNDDWSIGIANEKATLAEAMLAAIKQEFEQNSFMRALFPERVPDFANTTWKADRIVIARKKPNPISPSVLATGVGATVTGVHMHEWILDDIISQDAAENAYRGSFTEIEATNRWLSRIQPLLKNPKRDPITIIGTRWWEGDSYEHVEKRLWGDPEDRREYVWTLTLSNGEVQHHTLVRTGELAIFKRPIQIGQSWFPERLSDSELARFQQEDPVFFAGQYLLEPTASGATEFRPEWLQYFEWEGEHQIRFRNEASRIEFAQVRDMAIAVSVDPAFSDKRSAARSAIPVVGVLGKRKFLLEDFSQRGLSVDGIANIVCEFISRYRPRVIFVETIVAQVAVADAIRRVARERGLGEPPIEEIKSHGRDKDWRIYGLEPYFKRAEFFTHARNSRFLTEYVSFPRGAFRDILDALAFQRDFWERAASLVGGPGSAREADDRALARLKANVGRGGGY